MRKPKLGDNMESKGGTGSAEVGEHGIPDHTAAGMVLTETLETEKGLVRADRKELAGLTAAELEERVAGGLTNRVNITTGKTTAQIVSSNLFTYFNHRRV